jgi:U3 small nucleolar RNA-associated protein 10
LLDTCVGYLTNEDVEVFVSCVAAVTGISLILGARMIGHFAKIVPVVLERSEEDDHEMVQYATLGLFGGLIKRIPSFMSSSLKKVFGVAFKSTVAVETRRRLLETIVHVMDAKPVIDSLCATWKVAVEANYEAITLHLDTLDMVVDASSKKDIGAHSVTLVKFLLEAFETRATGGYNQNDTNRIEAKIIASGLKIVMKLNDKTFRPLFIRMVRWAIDGEGSNKGVDERSRLVIFFKFLVKVLGSLKSIITNYYGYLVDPVCDILARFSTQKAHDEPLRRSILNSLITSFQYDRDEFWQSQARFDKISNVLVDQIPTIEPGLGHTLVRSIVTLAELCSSPDYNRTINDAICVHLKESCTTNEKIWAIRTLKGLYSKLGEEWVTMLPQLVPLIAELLEDEEEIVEDEVRKQLVPVVEEVLGESLDRYLS